MTSKPHSVVLFGATGFTGKLVLKYLSNTPELVSNSWAIAGRNETKLKGLLDTFEAVGNKPSVIVADLGDAESVERMVKSAKAIVTTAGPYSTYGGETLVKACASNGVHYCDLSGEHWWAADMIAKYDALAQSTGAKIVLAAGVDSIPSDLGVLFCESNLGSDEPESFRALFTAFVGSFSGGTLASGRAGADALKSGAVSKELFWDPYSTVPGVTGPDTTDDGCPKQGRWFDADFNTFVNKFFMASANARIVRRSLAARHAKDNTLDVSYAEMMSFGALARMGWLFVSNGMKMLRGVNPLRKGLKPGDGPPEWVQEQGYFRVEVLGRGKSGSSARVSVAGKGDPGYRATSKMISETVLCLAFDDEKTPNVSGVITPAIACGMTLINRLEKVDGGDFIQFKVLQSSSATNSSSNL